jgi:hypothetical protein
MRSKRLHESPETSSEKSGQRICFDGSTLSNTSGVTSPPATETDDQESPPPGNDAHPQTGLHSAAHPDHPEQSVILCDQADHENQHATETGNSQSLILIQRTSVCDQQDSLADTTSASLNVRAVGEMLINWPSYSAGLTTGICDLKTLKPTIASDDLSDNHKAMWVSLVQRFFMSLIKDLCFSASRISCLVASQLLIVLSIASKSPESVMSHIFNGRSLVLSQDMQVERENGQLHML